MFVTESHAAWSLPADAQHFPMVDAWIHAQANTTVQGHGVKQTFASIAEELVSGAVLKKISTTRRLVT